MTLELFNYTLIGIRSLFEPRKEGFDFEVYLTGKNKASAKKFLNSIYDPSLFNNNWALERVKEDVVLINPKEGKAIIPVSFTDHPNLKAREYGYNRYKLLVEELKRAISKANSLVSEVRMKNPGFDVSILCLDKSLGYLYEVEEGSELDGYYPLNDIDIIDYIKKLKIEYFIIYTPIRHMPTPGYDEIGEYESTPRISIMDMSYEGNERARSFKYAIFKEVNL